MQRLTLTGRIFRDGELLVCECPELRQTTWGGTLESVTDDARRMIEDYFDACSESGSLEPELRRLGIPAVPTTMQIDLTLDTKEVFGADAGLSEQHMRFPYARAS